ncbi:hypothetical protein [Nocardioides massiliensis]|uniref:Uncharacterized protein n=1 Tax=Nocardioides massiliensis TaxID=1325935 RepID=A0ABT9NSE0_9ACTN|nr:hypothetical protein [Nocardioides massiliensis]MDP9823318.1 hypothetical protein [Nocardioides massiliensis]
MVLPLVRGTVDNAGLLCVTIDGEPLAQEAPGLDRSELRPLLDRISAERGSALRVEIHEPDGKVFTDFHTPAAPDPAHPVGPTPASAALERSGRDGRPTVRVQAGSVRGEGFQPDEVVVVAIVVHRASTNSDGTLDLNLPVALLDRTAGNVVLVGQQSGATQPSSDNTAVSGRKAS